VTFTFPQKLNPDPKSGYKPQLRLTAALDYSLKHFTKTKLSELSLKLNGSTITKKEHIRHFVVISCNSTFISTFNLSTTNDKLNI